jgi:hypothetical protein
VDTPARHLNGCLPRNRYRLGDRESRARALERIGQPGGRRELTQQGALAALVALLRALLKISFDR